jgi:site-specific recombinase XerD
MGKKYTNHYLHLFESYLQEENMHIADNTLKNYRADVGQFITWYEEGMKKKFIPHDVTAGNIEYYILYSKYPYSVLQRHLSSLRKFFTYLEKRELLSDELVYYFKKLKERNSSPSLQQFGLYLRVENASEQTIKHYKIDVKHFLSWAGKSLGIDSLSASKDTLFTCIDNKMLQAYITDLVATQNASNAVVYRKKAAVNKFLLWLQITSAS